MLQEVVNRRSENLGVKGRGGVLGAIVRLGGRNELVVSSLLEVVLDVRDGRGHGRFAELAFTAC